MEIVQPSWFIEQCPSYKEALRVIELAARTCYKSEEHIGPGTAEKLIRKILKLDRRKQLTERVHALLNPHSGLPASDGYYALAEKAVDIVLRDLRENPAHESVLEHVVVSVRFVFDRGLSHELVRHRIGASYSQESTRFCNYGKKGVRVIDPLSGGRGCSTAHQAFYTTGDPERDKAILAEWAMAMVACSTAYENMIRLGAQPQRARSVLPQSTKTEVFTTFNLRSWRHFFELRTTDACHPQMVELSRPLLAELKRRLPVFFEDL